MTYTRAPMDNRSYPIDPAQERTAILLGAAGLERLRGARILLAGLGGVGGAAAEALARAGVGHLTLLDHDIVAPSNLNRQIIALHSTLGRGKTQVMAERLRDINPVIDLDLRARFLRPEDAPQLLAEQGYDYVIDCIDSIACKAALVLAAQQAGRAVISSMGAGGRIDPTRIHVARLNQTAGCGLAREMRKTLKRLGGRLNYPVVYSDEQAVKGLAHQPVGDPPGRPRSVNGTISYLPALFGFTLAGYVVKDLLHDLMD